jgi:hypothetical protein
MSFAGIILLVMVFVVIGALTGAMGRRTGIVAGIAALGLVGLMLLLGLFYFARSAAISPQAPAAAVMWSDSNGAMSVSFQDDMSYSMPPNVAHAKWRIAFFPLLLLAGALAVIVLFGLFRRTGGAACATGSHRRWWPAALLLLLVPLGFFFLAGLVGTRQVQREASVAHRFDAEAEMRARQIHEHVQRQQAELERRQAAIEHQASKLSSELEHRIDNMEINKLMDLVDAPRIILPIPTPATIAHWAQIATAEHQFGEAASAVGTSQNSAQSIAEVQPKADAAVELIAAESESGLAEAAISAESVPPIAENSSPALAASLPAEPARSASIEESRVSRPQWVERAPKRVGNVRRDVIVTDEYASIEDCERAADRLLQLETYEHVQRLVGKPIDAEQSHRMRNQALGIVGSAPLFLAELEKAGITIDYIHHEIARDEYLEKVERSVGEMLKLYTQIEFTPSVENELRQRWQVRQRQERFALVGLGAGGVMGLLGLAWGLLKFDTWTKGYYTKRLFIGVPLLAILGTFGLYAWLLAMGFDLPH